MPIDDNGSATAVNSINNDEVQPSAPASVHDDADDESELSELDEDEVQEIEQEVHKDGLLVRGSASVATIPFSTSISADRNSFEDRVTGEFAAGAVAGIMEVDDEVDDEVESGDREGGDEDTNHVLPQDEDTVMR